MLSVYTRHYLPCTETDPNYRRCKCPKWINGTLPVAGFVRKSARTRSWERAERQARLLEKEDEERQLGIAASGPNNKRAATLVAAVDAYLRDKREQNLAPTTIEKLEVLFKKHFLTWAKAKAIVTLPEITLQDLGDFRSTWVGGALTRKKRQERLVGFFHFCQRHGWIKDNVATGLSRIRVDDGPVTNYFSREEFDKIIDATYIYNPIGYTEPRKQATRLRVLTLLMRWSGLAIGDALTLERTRLNKNDELFLYRAKTGVPVFVKLPPDVAQALRDIPPGPKPNPAYFFWSGNGDRQTIVKDWERSYRRLFDLVNLKNPDGTKKRCFPHMFRDTFAVELLLAGVPIDQVSLLLGHKSVKTTEKHYAPFVKARQEQLVASVQKAWYRPEEPEKPRRKQKAARA